MTAVTGAYVDASNQTAIETQLLSLGVTGDKVIVIRAANGNKVYLGKVE